MLPVCTTLLLTCVPTCSLVMFMHVEEQRFLRIPSNYHPPFSKLNLASTAYKFLFNTVLAYQIISSVKERH